MKTFQFLIYFFLLSLSVTAQYSLSGTVKNEQSEHLISALVWLEGTDYATVTDDSGFFQLKNIPAGAYQLKVSYVGYKTRLLPITLSQSVEMDIIMQGVIYNLDNIEIRASKVKTGQPFTYTNVSRSTLQKENLGADMPYLLQWTPSMTVTSDAGTGIGYTGLRMRGTDQTRLNVTINGVPLNDAESHDVFWVDLPDLGSSVSSVQIQRGVGPSANGPGAFGGTIGIQTHQVHVNPYADISASAGSFATRKFNVNLGSGMINDRYTVDARYSRILSDGYVDRASADLKSWYVSAARLTEKSSLRINAFSGKEITYQSWNGVPEAKVRNDNDALIAHYFNNIGSIYKTPEDSLNLFNSDRRYNYYTYPNQVDNYTQTHVQMHHSLITSPKWTINSIAYYTKGQGYFEQFRFQDKISNYGLPDALDGNGNVVSRTDIVRRRWLDNDLFGIVADAVYNAGKNYLLQVGTAMSSYIGDHFGNIANSGINLEIDREYRYYDNTGKKTDFSAYIRQEFSPLESIDLFADFQIRGIRYAINGIDQDLRLIDLDSTYLFFNPKVGLNYNLDANTSLYASYSIAQREPARADFLDNAYGLVPRPEYLGNLEAGMKKRWGSNFFNANLYYMHYRDQLVLSGDLNDVGAAIRTNVGESYRLGIELEMNTKISDKIYLASNMTLSRNKIKRFDEILYDYTTDFERIIIPHTNTDIAFSPSVNASVQVLFLPFKHMEAEISSRFVGPQYLDNTSDNTRRLDAYHFQNLRLAYSKMIGTTEVRITGLLNNMFNRLYSSNGYTYSYIFGERITENFLYPQAGRNWMIGVEVKI